MSDSITEAAKESSGSSTSLDGVTAQHMGPNEESENQITEEYQREIHEQTAMELARTITGGIDESEAIDDTERSLNEEGAAMKKASFWSHRNKQTRKIFFPKYIAILCALSVYLLSVFSIYWGAMYNRGTRLVNLNVLVNVEDNHDSSVTSTLLKTIEDPALSKLAGWHVQDKFRSEEEIIDLVHRQKYWGSVYITSAKASALLESSLVNGTTLKTPLIKAYVETGRDPNGINSYVKPAIMELEGALRAAMQQGLYPQLTKSLSDSQKLNALTSIMDEPSFILTDGRPLKDPTLMAPLMVGLIYLIILTFFQCMAFIDPNTALVRPLTTKSYVLYRMITPQFTYLFLSLIYTCLNRAFQINFTATWKGGFAIFWMFSYLTMSAVGGANENIMLLALPVAPPLMGCWMLFFVCANVSGTFSPIETCPEFYRFTYAMPIKNAYELSKVVFFDTYRGHMGREIGVLIAWIVLNNLIMPFALRFFGTRMAKKAQQAAAAGGAPDAPNPKGGE